jgi:nucleoside phosphorylase
MEHGILLVVALGWETAAIAREINAFPFRRSDSARLLRGNERHRGLWILQTGMGPERASKAIRWAAEAVRPTVVLSTGCAGSLAAGPRSGDVVVAEEIVSARGSAIATNAAWRERYRRAAVDARLRVWESRMLTTSRMLSGSEEKRRLGEEANARAVEMEGAALAEWTRAAGIEFAAARVILDPVETSLPAEISGITTDADRPSPRSLLRAIGRRPALILELARLAAATLKCRRALAAVHRELIRGLSHDGLLPK